MMQVEQFLKRLAKHIKKYKNSNKYVSYVGVPFEEISTISIVQMVFVYGCQTLLSIDFTSFRNVEISSKSITYLNCSTLVTRQYHAGGL